MSATPTGITAIAVLTCLMLAPTSLASAQELQAINSLADGKTAVLFEVNGDFNLSSFEGTTISLKRHYSDNRAYRIGVSVRIASNNQDNSSNAITQYEDEIDLAGITLGITKLYHHAVSRPVSFFYGAGPRVRYDRERRTNHQLLSQQISHRKDDEWGVAVSLLAGVEWFVRPSISLMAEYGSTLEYSSNESKTYTGLDSSSKLTLSRTQTDKLWGLNPDPVRFGLSLYW